MTRHALRVRTAVILTGATLSVLVVSAAPASAAYRAWFSPWSYVGTFEAGDVSEGYKTLMVPPPGACGLRLLSPSSFYWANDEGAIVQTDEGQDESGPINGDATIWIDGPGCSRPFSVTDGNNPLDFPENGAVWVELMNTEGAYWVTEEGCHLTGCGGVDPYSDDEATTPSDYWSVAVVASFTAVTPSIVDPQRQPRAVNAITSLSRDVAQLQPVLQNLIANRRRVPLGVIEASVRSLEDAAVKSLNAARSSVATCETRARQRAYADAFVACAMAGSHLEHSAALIRTARWISR